MTSSKPTPFEILGLFDAQFGLLSALAALKEHSHTITNNNLDFDMKKFIIRMRQFMALEETYTNQQCNKKNSEICNMSKPDQLLFKKKVITKLITNYSDKIFQDLIKQGHFTSYNMPPKGKKCYTVSKKIPKESHGPFLPQMLKNALNLPYVLQSIADFTNYSVINNERDFKNRVLLTEELNKQLVQLDILQFTKKHDNVLEDAIKQYDKSMVFALVGTTREYLNQTVLYVMCHYTDLRKKNLENSSIELDNFIPHVFEKHHRIKSILKKCANLCNPPGHKCFIRKVLGTPLGFDNYCVIFFVTFSADIHKGSQKHIPIRNLIHDNRERLDNWEFYMERNAQISSFSLDDDVKEDNHN